MKIRTIFVFLLIVVLSLAAPHIENVEEGAVQAFDGIRDTVFILFTRRNPTAGQIVLIDDMRNVSDSYYDRNQPTKVLFHGMFSDRNNPTNNVIRPAYLQAGDFNIIVVDWGMGASDFATVLLNMRYAASAVAGFLDNLHDAGLLNFTQLTLVGHSIGAHLAGFTGKYVRGRVNTIIALDAPIVGDINDPSTRIDSSDAEYVELIQTEISIIAIPAPVGHANFYPGGGMNQPYCPEGNGECNHMIAIDYFAESLSTEENRFYAQRCSSIDEMRANACGNMSAGYIMGGANSNYVRELRGIFRLPVNGQRPFAVGMQI